MSRTGEGIADRYRRVLEYSLFAWVVLGALMIAAFVTAMTAIEPVGAQTGPTQLTPGPTGLAAQVAGLVIVGIVLYTLLFQVFAAIGLYMDASVIAEADLEWSPSPGLYAAGGLLFSALAVLHYLWKRYEYVPPSPTSKLWGKATLACTIGGVVALFIAPTRLHFLFVSALAIAIYHDAKSVTFHTEWDANPASYFTYVLLTAILFVVPYLVGGYYLYRRQRAA